MLSQQLENIDSLIDEDTSTAKSPIRISTKTNYPITGLAFADLHSGHFVGFTPRDFDNCPNNPHSAEAKLYTIRRKCYDFVMEEVEKLRPIDFAIIPGDCIEGKGDRSGGRELLFSDRGQQVNCATAAIKDICGKTAQIVMSYGTGYHTGKEEDWEKRIAENVGAIKIGGHDWCNAGGVVFDYKHKIGSSSIPHGRATALKKSALWAQIWHMRKEYPLGDVLIRAHVHYHEFAGSANIKPGLMMTLPALQAYGSIFGTRECEGVVDFGFVFFKIYQDGKFDWGTRIYPFDNLREVEIL